MSCQENRLPVQMNSIRFGFEHTVYVREAETSKCSRSVLWCVLSPVFNLFDCLRFRAKDWRRSSHGLGPHGLERLQRNRCGRRLVLRAEGRNGEVTRVDVDVPVVVHLLRPLVVAVRFAAEHGDVLSLDQSNFLVDGDVPSPPVLSEDQHWNGGSDEDGVR